jgi:Glycosyl transferases group 1
MPSLDCLNIVLQEDLTIRGGAQLWLMNCGIRLCATGHSVTIILPTTSLLLEDLVDGPMTVETYDAEAIAENPNDFQERFTLLLKPCQVCVTLVRPQRGKFQNVDFMARCIDSANLDTYLIAKTGTPDPTYQKHFYGGPLLDKTADQCCVITIAEYTKTFIVEHMGVPAERITNVYNGTDTTRFKRTPEMASEAIKRYPCVPGAYVVGCIGSYEERKAQIVLLQAAKKLIEDGRLKNIYCLFVGEGPDKDMLHRKIAEYGLQQNAILCNFTKEPFYVFERCNLIALPSTGKEGLPNVLLEALAMEKPCVATRYVH